MTTIRLDLVVDIFTGGISLRKSRSGYYCIIGNRIYIPYKRRHPHPIVDNYIRYSDTYEPNSIIISGYINIDGYLIVDGIVNVGEYINIAKELQINNSLGCNGDVTVGDSFMTTYDDKEININISGDLIADSIDIHKNAVTTINIGNDVTGNVSISLTTCDLKCKTINSIELINKGSYIDCDDINLRGYFKNDYNNVTINQSRIECNNIMGYGNIDNVKSYIDCKIINLSNGNINNTINGEIFYHNVNLSNGYIKNYNGSIFNGSYINISNGYIENENTSRIECIDIDITNTVGDAYIKNSSNGNTFKCNNITLNGSLGYIINDGYLTCNDINLNGNNGYIHNINGGIINSTGNIILIGDGARIILADSEIRCDKSITCQTIYLQYTSIITMLNSSESIINVEYLRKDTTDILTLNVYINNSSCFDIIEDRIQVGITLIKHYYNGDSDTIYGALN